MGYARDVRGFSLIELLLAIALGGLILVASSSLMMSLMEIWAREQAEDNFRDHVSGLEHFLGEHFYEAHFSIEGALRGVVPGQVPGYQSGKSARLLAFVIEFPSEYFRPEEGPITCYLEFDPEVGLSVIWHSIFRESNLNLPVYRRVISPWVKKVMYESVNEETGAWESSDALVAPLAKFSNKVHAMTLSLEYNGEAFEIVVPLNVELGDKQGGALL